ncbi:MAG: pyridoxal-dependent decarboxylase [Candidatus Neomarinimicrobiota bacterium]|nr:MAG: aspartate aminotransferase family protein [Candidatus Marinimicrobia bacterium TMED108]|tara:strand:+ start:1944 stop:3377 length:1434 start_codon:yes stop_codon:yes gene_type:complete
MNKTSKLHMTTDEFRKQGYKVIDWLVEYYENIEEYPVLSQVKPGEIRSNLPKDPPLKGRNYDDVLSDMDIMMPGMTHWQSPNFHAFFPCASSGPAILADMIATGTGIVGMLWETSPSCTEVETHVLDWLVDMMGMPEKFKSSTSGGGVIQDTASSSTLISLIGAREQSSKGEFNSNASNSRLTTYVSSHSHSSIEKAVKVAGLGKNSLRVIDADEKFAMIPHKLKEQIERDILDGYIPTFVCASVGTTNTTAMDPISEIGQICKEYNIWLHVDAAMAGAAALCPEFRYLQEGLEYANSYTFNPHKWMLTNFDCSVLFIDDRDKITSAMSVIPEYLKNKGSESGEVIDYMDWSIPLGRKFRGLKLWQVINYYGIEGLQEYIREHVDHTQQLKTWIEEDNNFEIVAPVPLNLICFKHKKGSDFNRRLHEAINQTGKLYITKTKINNEYILRFSIGQATGTIDHIRKSWKLIQKIAENID